LFFSSSQQWNISQQGKAALVTGASKGVGKDIAPELARAGCEVAVNYNRDRAGAIGTVNEIAGGAEELWLL
jgi:NAD(P)-dependent dehydrogenase (short-subunit alcohol dehydrogenase family)